MTKKNITVVGMGYVGLSNLLLLAPHHHMLGLEVDAGKINLLQQGKSPLKDKEIEEYLTRYHHDISFIKDKNEAYLNAEYIIIATPTDYDEKRNYFDTSTVVQAITDISEINPQAIIIIKSTIPFGFMEGIKFRYPNLKVVFSPEFLREGKALYDNLHPSRIVVGDNSDLGDQIANLFKSASLDENTPIICTGSNESEAIKLFANNYLAMRVAYFNELDSFALKNNLNTKDVINGISTDSRIANGYNNPSFGYGGYCLPKDTKQLLANFSNVPQNLIQAIVDANETRKNFIVHSILDLKPKTVGIYRLIMKEGSDNFRSSSIQDVIFKLYAKNLKIVVYEPTLNEKTIEGFEVNNHLEDFAKHVDVIIANRIDKPLEKFRDKVFSRDVFHEN